MEPNSQYLHIPATDKFLTPGCKVKLGRFSTERWIVRFGWYEVNGNRPVCGWYFTSFDNLKVVKPVQLPDLNDIYIIEQ